MLEKLSTGRIFENIFFIGTVRLFFYLYGLCGSIDPNLKKDIFYFQHDIFFP